MKIKINASGKEKRSKHRRDEINLTLVDEQAFKVRLLVGERARQLVDRPAQRVHGLEQIKRFDHLLARVRRANANAKAELLQLER